jgi:transposase
MRTGRPKAELVLSEQENRELNSLARRSRTAPQLARRARIVLACARGLDVTPQTVGTWRTRFVEQRLEGLLDEPRPGAPRQITDAQVEEVITRTLESTPRGATHWSTRSMAKAEPHDGQSDLASVRTPAAPE